MIDIVQEGHPILRQTADEVPVAEITSPRIKNVITDMKEALAEQEDGVAIAAPQIGVSLRIFVVSKRAFMLDKHGNPLELSDDEIAKFEDVVYINPKITSVSKKTEWLPEGCLSVRWKYGKVRRSVKATVTAYDEKGEPFTRGASGLMAQIFQHEVAHLNGELFIDAAKDIEDAPPEKQA